MSNPAAMFELNARIDRELTNLATAHVVLRNEGFTDAQLEPIRVAQQKIRDIRNSIDFEG